MFDVIKFKRMYTQFVQYEARWEVQKGTNKKNKQKFNTLLGIGITFNPIEFMCWITHLPISHTHHSIAVNRNLCTINKKNPIY